MGEWEHEYDKCADCGATLRASDEYNRKLRIDQPLHYYAVTHPITGAKRKVCPACWTTARTAPTVRIPIG